MKAFKDRAETGNLLADRLLDIKEFFDMVIAIPRGGVVVAGPIADRLGIPMGVVYSKKIPTPGEPELASGACMLDTKKFGETPPILNKKIILVDDGIATGATIEKAIEFLKTRRVGEITIAVPVAPTGEVMKLEGIVKKIVVLETQDEFGSIGEFYKSFPQVSDKEVIQLLQGKMKVIIGIGNPGQSYLNTRHNVGHMVIDELHKVARSKKQVAGWNNVKIFKSDKFMNDSGLFVKKLTTSYKLPATDLYIVHDDLDIPLGEFKIQFGKGPKDHNGILSIEKEIGTKDFWRVRIGIENRSRDARIGGEEYVLQNFNDEEKQILDSVIKQACKKLKTVLNNQ